MPITEHLHARVATRANVYFDGKCVSHSLTLEGGVKKSVGVVLPSALTFNTGAAEIMECVAGACDWRMKGTEAWSRVAVGERFDIPANSAFEIRVEGEPFHYICHFSDIA